MMHKYIIAITITFFNYFQVVSQQTYLYFDEDLQQVTKEQYQNKLDTTNLYDYFYFSNDTTVSVLLHRYREYSFDYNTNSSLWSTLDLLTEEDLDREEFVIINYLHGIDTCGGEWTIKEASKALDLFERDINDLGDGAMVYLHYGDVELEKYQALRPYALDRDGVIANQFWPVHVLCSSYAILRRDGQAVSILGETSFDELYRMTVYLLDK